MTRIAWLKPYLATNSTPSKSKRKDSSESGREHPAAPHLPPVPTIPSRSASHLTPPLRNYEDSLGIVTELLARQPGRRTESGSTTAKRTEASQQRSTPSNVDVGAASVKDKPAGPSKSKSLDLVREVDRVGPHNARASLNLLDSFARTELDKPDLSTQDAKRKRTEPEASVKPASPVSLSSGVANPEPSRFKTLQLLARRPFGGLSKKKAAWRDERTSQATLASNRSWWQSRSALPLASDDGQSHHLSEARNGHLAPRHSEDLLSRASTRVSSDIGPKSKSVDLGKLLSICRCQLS